MQVRSLYGPVVVVWGAARSTRGRLAALHLLSMLTNKYTPMRIGHLKGALADPSLSGVLFDALKEELAKHGEFPSDDSDDDEM